MRVTTTKLTKTMTYNEAQQYSLTVKWKTATCTQGEKCWCRAILPEEEILDKDGNEIIIVHDGAMPKEYAEHIVKLHNASLFNLSQNTTELIKESQNLFSDSRDLTIDESTAIKSSITKAIKTEPTLGGRK